MLSVFNRRELTFAVLLLLRFHFKIIHTFRLLLFFMLQTSKSRKLGVQRTISYETNDIGNVMHLYKQDFQVAMTK